MERQPLQSLTPNSAWQRSPWAALRFLVMATGSQGQPRKVLFKKGRPLFCTPPASCTRPRLGKVAHDSQYRPTPSCGPVPKRQIHTSLLPPWLLSRARILKPTVLVSPEMGRAGSGQLISWLQMEKRSLLTVSLKSRCVPNSPVLDDHTACRKSRLVWRITKLGRSLPSSAWPLPAPQTPSGQLFPGWHLSAMGADYKGSFVPGRT